MYLAPTRSPRSLESARGKDRANAPSMPPPRFSHKNVIPCELGRYICAATNISMRDSFVRCAPPFDAQSKQGSYPRRVLGESERSIYPIHPSMRWEPFAALGKEVR